VNAHGVQRALERRADAGNGQEVGHERFLLWNGVGQPAPREGGSLLDGTSRKPAQAAFLRAFFADFSLAVCLATFALAAFTSFFRDLMFDFFAMFQLLQVCPEIGGTRRLAPIRDKENPVIRLISRHAPSASGYGHITLYI
jgi:hypothetical protein